ncbi:general transcription factor 3C polypeptide 5-like [Pteropus medius]|uniref:general transcription factor 3C polypeptide 5-like n=1 Tax=Pteropus vampyrus TaxID=132908 RepID=UPI00196A6593|nr:general transcription factor 3C polypeptide 5-like [Pteropus giganteus]
MAAGAADAGPGIAVPVELRRERRLVCVECPGMVRDVSKMLPTLGGEEGVSRIYADPTKRLELYFRPKDPYCHPVCANRFSTSSLLLRIKRKTKRQQAVPGSRTHPEVTLDVEILGIVSTIYKFQGNRRVRPHCHCTGLFQGLRPGSLPAGASWVICTVRRAQPCPGVRGRSHRLGSLPPDVHS